MARTASVRLTDHFERFVEEQTASGRYASLDEMIEAGLALLEERGQEDALDFGPAPTWTRQALEEAIREGEESGLAGPFDVDRFIAEMRHKTAVREG